MCTRRAICQLKEVAQHRALHIAAHCRSALHLCGHSAVTVMSTGLMRARFCARSFHTAAACLHCPHSCKVHSHLLSAMQTAAWQLTVICSTPFCSTATLESAQQLAARRVHDRCTLLRTHIMLVCDFRIQLERCPHCACTWAETECC